VLFKRLRSPLSSTSATTAVAGVSATSNPGSGTSAATTTEGNSIMEKATFGAGCFWGVEATFRNVKGVTATRVGYLGGTMKNPTYRDVCSGRTGHAEVVEVTYDPEQVSYDDLLKVFWENHDPTQLNRQGPDHGTQYRSAIFFHSPEQEAAAHASKQRLDDAHRHRRPIATEVTPTSDFYEAEDYHQQYLEKRGMASCHI
jgi:peptide-methionine (S)-S-oxide reductase